MNMPETAPMTAEQSRIQELEEQVRNLAEQAAYYKSECNSIWAEQIRQKEHHLSVARRIASTDSKNIANLILNMYFGKTPSDSIGFCDAFALKEMSRCARFARCTDCIDNLLLDYAKARTAAMQSGDATRQEDIPWPEGSELKNTEPSRPSSDEMTCGECAHNNVRRRTLPACLCCRRRSSSQEELKWKRNNYTIVGPSNNRAIQPTRKE